MRSVRGPQDQPLGWQRVRPTRRVCLALARVLLFGLGAFEAACGPQPAPAAARGGMALSTDPADPERSAGDKLELSRTQALELLCRVLVERDRDCDRKITIEDEKQNRERAESSAWPYALRTQAGVVALTARHEAAQLVQELVLAVRSQQPEPLVVDLERVRADPASYLGYRIRTHYWDALTRRIDAAPAELARAAADQKVAPANDTAVDLCPELARRCAEPVAERVPVEAAEQREPYVYYPSSDPLARAVFEKASVPGRLRVLPLPARIDAAWLRETTRARRHGLLTLALDANGRGLPFVVPGGRFNELYGWDSYFIVRGLLDDPAHFELAKSTVENQAYEIEKYSKILNANRTYYLTRSQPPFFSSSVLEVARHMDDRDERRRWLARVLPAAIREYFTVWTAPPRRLPLCEGKVCLARYFGEGRGEPPEVEPVHFYQTHAVAHAHCAAPGPDADSRGRFLDCVSELSRRYREGELEDAAIDRFFQDDRCMRESGHDTTFRWFDARERCSEFASVDLNSLLFKYEVDIAELLAEWFGGELSNATAADFCARARTRAGLVQRYLWDASRGAFFDYDVIRARRSRYLAATTFYPLWASPPNVCGASLVTREMAEALRASAAANGR